jgi:hypothetical protein
VHPEYYVLADDGVGRRFADALSEKATASFDRAPDGQRIAPFAKGDQSPTPGSSRSAVGSPGR